MAKIHLLGTARIGKKRELKFALERYWRDESSAQQLQQTASTIREENRALASSLDFVQVGDFSLYDHVLDTSLLLGNLPKRTISESDTELNNYFRAARGRANHDHACTHASEMTKWFDTNYHYIVPEFDDNTEFSLNPSALLKQINEASATGGHVKPVLLGPVTYLYLGKHTGNKDKLKLLDKLLPIYAELFELFARRNIEWVQIDEPALVLELAPEWQLAYRYAYQVLKTSPVKLLLTTYFDNLADNLNLVSELPVEGLHIDVSKCFEEATYLAKEQHANQVLSLGVIDGRNVWCNDLSQTLDKLEPLAAIKAHNLWLAPSCSLLHVPVDLALEQNLNQEIRQWLAFGIQKISELNTLSRALKHGRSSVQKVLDERTAIIKQRQLSEISNNTQIKDKLTELSKESLNRPTAHKKRNAVQQQHFNLPLYPTTTIGSFPQTNQVREKRSAFKKGQLSEQDYLEQIQAEIKQTIDYQIEVGLDVLVHGEAERNDMVEYFGELLDGITTSTFGWVQSYGSRCVKPPIIYGDVFRSQPLTVSWANYAQSLTQKLVKGMLTGPVTILNWSFVRDDQPLELTCKQIAIAIREEVLELEANNINIIQIDEAALREGLPLKQTQWNNYLGWAIDSFKACVNTVKDTTQIHTHMCYSEFDDIIDAIARMDADVITIENSRSDNALLETFKKFAYPNQIGPGVYDIHSPNTPTVDSITSLIKSAADLVDTTQLWVNPDCGLKTRQWHEVKPALANMVEAAKQLRTLHAQQKVA